MRQGLLQVWFLWVGMGLMVDASAQDQTTENLAPGFKFQKNESLLNPRLSSTLDSSHDTKSIHRSIQGNTQANTYDAIFYYPLHRRGLSVDLGVNLRLQEEPSAQTNQASAYDQDWLNIDPSETRTLIHAAAVFDLPFSGFKAGVSGTYTPGLADSEYDYRAKLSYKWKSGLGLEGGWQHQQKSLEQDSLSETQDAETLYLDLNYRF